MLRSQERPAPLCNYFFTLFLLLKSFFLKKGFFTLFLTLESVQFLTVSSFMENRPGRAGSCPPSPPPLPYLPLHSLCFFFSLARNSGFSSSRDFDALLISMHIRLTTRQEKFSCGRHQLFKKIFRKTKFSQLFPF